MVNLLLILKGCLGKAMVSCFFTNALIVVTLHGQFSESNLLDGQLTLSDTFSKAEVCSVQNTGGRK